ncbi:MAG: ribosome small subunit-dependent GTPase A [Christensenellaceae bacterium]|jgi:ribosome biogenesis GTPase|nr:ribosome small subunit-dependent GTPase A [Christensenellaceae bacterium]
MMEGVVTKVISNRYTVKCEDQKYIAHARGRIKLDKDIFVGDRVQLIKSKPYAIIDKILPRTNELSRLAVANVDVVVIVIAIVPTPDLVLVDKIIVKCHKEGIRPVICYNKTDLATTQQIALTTAGYRSFDLIKVSASTEEGLSSLDEIIENNVVCFAGQSAVGKTSLINAISDLNLKTGQLSYKISRGKNTTRHVESYELKGGIVIDTCGFSMFDINDLKSNELKYYYDDYMIESFNCKYKDCNHINEPECAVKKKVNEKKLNRGRYLRYRTIYKELDKK